LPLAGEYGAIVTDDAKLELDVHGRWHAGVFQKLQGIRPANYPPSPAQATQPPMVLDAVLDALVPLQYIAWHGRMVWQKSS
jgi:hypothetical protein